MKKQIELVAAVLAIFSSVFLISCGNGEEYVEEAIEDVVEEAAVVKNEAYYQIPSPDEMFGFIKESGLAFNGELLNPIENVSSYSDPMSQALNFGIYSADLAYTASFEQFNETTKYFATIQKLADPLSLSSAFDKSLIERAQANMENADSLVAITNTSYFSVVDYLDKNEQGNKLGIIAAAGWLETIYVVVNSANFLNDKEALERLVDQKLTLENLLGYLGEYQDDATVSEVLVWFNDLDATFSVLKESESMKSETSLEKNASGKMVLGGGTELSISEVQFNVIKDKINEIRSIIVKTEV